jgi:hypothetical protein
MAGSMPARAPLSFPGTDATVPNDRHHDGADSSNPATAFSGWTRDQSLPGSMPGNDGTGETQRPCTWSLLAASRVVGDTGGHGCLTRAGDVERGFRPRNGPTSTAGSRKPRPDEAVRGASAAGARSAGRMVRRGTSRPGGLPTVPAPRSADLDGRVGGGSKRWSELGG